MLEAMPAIAPIEDLRAIREEGLGFFAMRSGGLEPFTPHVSHLAVKQVRGTKVLIISVGWDEVALEPMFLSIQGAL